MTNSLSKTFGAGSV